MSHFGNQPLNFTLVAAVAIPQYHVVQASGTGYGGLATSANQVLEGIAQQATLAGDFVPVCPLGKSKVVAAGSLGVGARITANASGRVTEATAVLSGFWTDSGQVILGYTLQAATAAGDVITAFILAAGDKVAA